MNSTEQTMSVSGISSSSAAYQTPPNSQQMAAFKQNFSALTSALQSGNLQAAQSAYATLSQNLPSNAPGGQNNPFAKALSQIGSDLQSGNLSGAQQTLSSLQSQFKAHQHQGGGQGSGSSSGGATSGSSASSGGGGSSASSSATTTTVTTNPDGSTTTTVTNADGSIVSIITTDAPSNGQSSTTGNGAASLLNITA
jgi:hypothetical protein